MPALLKCGLTYHIFEYEYISELHCLDQIVFRSLCSSANDHLSHPSLARPTANHSPELMRGEMLRFSDRGFLVLVGSSSSNTHTHIHTHTDTQFYTDLLIIITLQYQIQTLSSQTVLAHRRNLVQLKLKLKRIRRWYSNLSLLQIVGQFCRCSCFLVLQKSAQQISLLVYFNPFISVHSKFLFSVHSKFLFSLLSKFLFSLLCFTNSFHLFCCHFRI